MKVSNRFVDFKQIQQWNVKDHVAAHESDLEWLNFQVSEISKSEPRRQMVIFTHYSPTLNERAVDKNYPDSSVSSGFSTDLSNDGCWGNPSVILWAFGHTHFNCNFIDGVGKQVAANQIGYTLAKEKTFNARKVFLVGRENAIAASVGAQIASTG